MTTITLWLITVDKHRINRCSNLSAWFSLKRERCLVAVLLVVRVLLPELKKYHFFAFRPFKPIDRRKLKFSQRKGEMLG